MEQVRIWNVRDNNSQLDPYIVILDKKLAPGRSMTIPKSVYDRVALLIQATPGLHVGETLPLDYQVAHGLVKAKVPKSHVRTHGPGAQLPSQPEAIESSSRSPFTFLTEEE